MMLRSVALLGSLLVLTVVCLASAQAGCGEFSSGDTPDAGSCVPPKCGGAGGRCNEVNACGFSFSCGDCVPPLTCVDGSCQCTRASPCATLGAACGTFDDGCGATASCGDCDGGSCQARGDNGAFACSAGACQSQEKSVTCSKKCKSQTDNCGELVDCGGCPNSELCGAVGAKACGCPARQTLINDYQYNGYNCPGTAGSCGTETLIGPIAWLYAQPHEGLVPLYRCYYMYGAGKNGFMLTTSASCEGGPYTGSLLLGYCATTAICGATALDRWSNTVGDIINAPAGVNIPSYKLVGTVCFTWSGPGP